MNDPSDDMFDDEDIVEATERCVGMSLDVHGLSHGTHGRMRRRTMRTEDDFEGLPVEAPPGYARP